VAGYKINFQKSIVFLFAHSESSEIEILKSTVHNSIKNMKYLEINVLKLCKLNVGDNQVHAIELVLLVR